MSRAHHIKMTGWLTVVIALGGAVSMGLPVRSPGQVHGPKPRPAPPPRPKQAPPPPKPIMKVSQPVIFTDEEVPLSWTTANPTSTYVTMIGEVFQHSRLLPGVIDHDQAFRYSGTAYPHRSQVPPQNPKPPTIPGVPSRRDLQHSPKESNWE